MQIGLKNKGINEGIPGPRHGKDYYAYLRDLDGNKICAFASNKNHNKILNLNI